MNKRLLPSRYQQLHRLPHWWSEPDTQTGAVPYQQFMSDTLHTMQDQVFDEAEKRIRAGTSRSTTHIIHLCDCEDQRRQVQTVGLRYGELISVDFTF